MNYQKIGENLKKARQRTELTQVEVPQKADIHSNYYARIERGEEKPTLETLEKIFKILKVKSPDIFPF